MFWEKLRKYSHFLPTVKLKQAVHAKVLTKNTKNTKKGDRSRPCVEEGRAYLPFFFEVSAFGAGVSSFSIGS